VSEQPHSLPSSRSAALGGVGVIFVTGTFAILAAATVLILARSYGFRMEAIDWVLLGFVLALTIGGGVALFRFIRRHPGAIGEARFDTRNAPDPDRTER
jgi:TRAP-type C4-dicarboxylate transport system permease small subunit